MQLEEMRGVKKLGEDDPALIEEIGRQKLELEEKNDALLQELQEILEALGCIDRPRVERTAGFRGRTQADSRQHGRCAEPAQLHSQFIARCKRGFRELREFKQLTGWEIAKTAITQLANGI